MSSKTAIVTDTNCGLRPEEAAELGIRVIPMPVILDGECFFEYDSISQAEFFEALKGGAEVSTSQPAPGAIQQCWDAVLEDCEELIYIPMSAGLSGECQTALGLAQDYGGRVRVADNRRISVTERQAALDALSLARQGRTAAEIQAIAAASVKHKLYHTTLCNHLLTWARRAATKEELSGITYSVYTIGTEGISYLSNNSFISIGFNLFVVPSL